MKITKEKYDSILNMLNSSDKESINVGLNTIDQLDLKSNLVQILFLLKESKCGHATWIKEAESTTEKLKLIIKEINSSNLTYKKILGYLVKEKVDFSQIEFFQNHFNEYLTDQYKSLGFDFIEKIETKFITTDEYKRRELSESV